MRLHLFYPRSLDSDCAAAIVSTHAEQHGIAVKCYPLVPVTPPTQYATPFKRILDRCVSKSQQQKLFKDDSHKRENESIVFINASPSTSEITQLEAWASTLTIMRHDDWTFDTEKRSITVQVYDSDFDDKLATCENVWKILFPHDPLPLAVQLIGRHAVTNINDKENLHCSTALWYEEIQPFAVGLRAYDTDPGITETKNAGMKLWEKFFVSLANNKVRKVINEGHAILAYLHATAGTEQHHG